VTSSSHEVLGCVPAQESSVDPDAFLVHTQINASTPEEVLFFGTAAAAPKQGKCAQLMEAQLQLIRNA
jgi:hypothetical protein